MEPSIGRLPGDAKECGLCGQPFKRGDVLLGTGNDRSRACHLSCSYENVGERTRGLMREMLHGRVCG